MTRFERFKTQLSKSQGFTLVELLVVMALISILAAMISGSFVSATIKARDSKRKSDIGQMQRSLEAYYNDYGVYPNSTNGGIVVGGSTLGWGATFKDGNGTIYMAQLPNDSKQPRIQYYYVSAANHKSYQIFTHLENTIDLQLLSTIPPTSAPGMVCGTTACNYGVSSSNIKVTDTLP